MRETAYYLPVVLLVSGLVCAVFLAVWCTVVVIIWSPHPLTEPLGGNVLRIPRCNSQLHADCDANRLVAARRRQPTPITKGRSMRSRAVAVLAVARLASGYVSTSWTTSTWVAPHRCAARCSYPRRGLSRYRAQPSAVIGGESTSAGGGVGTQLIAKPPLKVINGGGGGGGRDHVYYKMLYCAYGFLPYQPAGITIIVDT